MNVSAQPQGSLAIPFDHHRLDRLMDEAGIDVVVATSKHNVQYLTGGHRADFFDYMDATGVSATCRFSFIRRAHRKRLPISATGWRNFRPRTEPCGRRRCRPPPQAPSTRCRSGRLYAQAGLTPKRIAAEYGFLPYDAANVLRAAYPDADWVDGLFVLERQRAKKSADELAKLKTASEAVLASMQAVIEGHGRARPRTTSSMRCVSKR